MENRITYLILLLIALTMTSAVSVAQETKNEPQKKVQSEIDKADSSTSKKTDNDAKTITSFKSENEKKKQILRRRIIDAKTLEKRDSLLGKLLLKPFHLLAPIVSARLTKLEEDRQYEVLLKIKNKPISPKVGGVTEGSGFGVGIAASTRDRISKDFRLVASSLVTMKGYVGNLVGFEIEPEKFSKNKLKVSLIGEQLVLPRQHFFGRGAESSKQDETTYFHRQLGIKISGQFQLNRNIKFGVFSEFTRNDITDGTDSDENVLSESYDLNTLPGLERNIQLLDSGAFIQIEKLDSSNNPHSGWSSRFIFSNINGVGNRKFSWQNYKLDSRAYIPMGSKLRLLAFRFQGVFNKTRKDRMIPLFRLAKLGSGDTLRGYETSRFQAENSVHLSTEYRIKLMQGYDKQGFTGVEGVFFGDFGQVFDNRKELNWHNVRATWGGGLRFMTKVSTALTVLYARSSEGGRIIWKLGKTF